MSDRVVITADVIATTLETLLTLMESWETSRDSTLEGRFRVAVLGGEALASRWERALVAGLRLKGDVEFVDADDVAWELRMVKSPAEQQLLRAAGALGARALSVARRCAVPGATEADIVAACVAEVIRGGGAWYGGGLSSAESANSFAPTGDPFGVAPNTLRKVEAGDLVRLDAYGSIGGYIFDVARSFVVGRLPVYEQKLLLGAVRDSVRAGIDALRPGVTLGVVARRCETALSAQRSSADGGGFRNRSGNDRTDHFRRV